MVAVGAISISDVVIVLIKFVLFNNNADFSADCALNEVSDLYHSFSSFVRSAFAYRGFLPLSIM